MFWGLAGIRQRQATADGRAGLGLGTLHNMEQGWGSIKSIRAQMGMLPESSSTALSLQEALGQRQLSGHSASISMGLQPGHNLGADSEGQGQHLSARDATGPCKNPGSTRDT